MEKCTIVVVGRDRFSPTESCLETLLQNTPEPFDLIVVLGGAPEKNKKRLQERFGTRAQFIFTPQFLNPAQSRNLGLRATKTRLAVLMDNDVYVRLNWLAPLLECQQETHASMVVPIILETPKKIHTAGNNLYVTHDNDGKAYGHKILRYHGAILESATNLKRESTDYGELHCQLVETETALRIEAFDENIQEVGECDCGLTWQKAGCSQWFEPKSVAYYAIPDRVVHSEDIGFFIWRWDMRKILKGYEYFYKKWNIDITEHGNFKFFLFNYNNKLGLLPRLWRTESGLFIDKQIRRFFNLFQKPVKGFLLLWNRFRAKQLGVYEWPSSASKWL